MVTSQSPEAAEKLKALQLAYKQALPAKIEEISNLCCKMAEDESLFAQYSELYRLIHSLSGSAGTFGARQVCQAARELEIVVAEASSHSVFVSESIQNRMTKLVHLLGEYAAAWVPDDLHAGADSLASQVTDKALVYLVEDDVAQGKVLVDQIERNGYRVRHFVRVDDFIAAFKEDIPAAIVMDVVFPEGDTAGIDAIANLRTQYDRLPPVLFCSTRDDIHTRLAAAKVDATRFFAKPLDVDSLVRTLHTLKAQLLSDPYRVLIIDDDDTLLEYYRTILGNANLSVEVVNDPMCTLEAIESFSPDVIVLDVYMPECSGTDLANIIRQDERWDNIPIMFLSSESDPDQRLAALSYGGDEYLTKPFDARRLLAAVKARAKRARRVRSLNDELKSVLRENRFQLATLDVHAIVSSADIAGRITSANDRFCQVSGYTRDELIGQTHRILKSGVHPDSIYEDLWKTISSGKVWQGILCNRSKDGQEYWVDSTIVPFLDDKGKPYKYVSVRTDITALRQSEMRLKRSQEFANIGTWDWNILTGDLYWSDRIGPLFGYEQDVPETTYENFLAAVHPDDRDMVVNAVTQCVEGNAEYNIEHRVVWPDGSVHWVLENGDVIRSRDGTATHMLGVVQNIDARKQAEEDILNAKEEAEQANLAKSQFLSRMSHELRTPMNAIIGFAQLINMEQGHPLSESQQENVFQINKAAKHLLDLINEVLDLSRIEAGRMELSIEPVPLDSVLYESLILIAPQAHERGIEIVIQAFGEIIDAEQISEIEEVVRADNLRLKQIMLNLLSNAIKYNSENGKLILSCEKVDDEQIRISVTDSGKGLNNEQKEHLFIAFDRLGAEHKDIEGTGIGLVITKHMVEIMGGHIGVESTPGVGSTFWFTIPLDSTQKSEVVSSKKELTRSAEPEYILSSSMHDYTVLYIEDNPANLRLVTQLLGRRSDMHLWGAEEPYKGLEMAFENNPDLVLLDINLPGIDGFAVLERLRENEITKNTPVIAVSANAMPEDIQKAKEAGFNDYVTKPIDVKSLLKTVEKWLHG